MFDPHVRIGGATETSVTLAWENNLGNAAQVKIAPVVSGATSAAENCDGGVVLSAGTTSYTYSGLSSGNKYGFRVCATDGTSTTAGVPIWADTE